MKTRNLAVTCGSCGNSAQSFGLILGKEFASCSFDLNPCGYLVLRSRFFNHVLCLKALGYLWFILGPKYFITEYRNGDLDSSTCEAGSHIEKDVLVKKIHLEYKSTVFWRVCMFLFSMQFSYLSCPNYLDYKFVICGAPCTPLCYKFIIIILNSCKKGNEVKIQFYYSCYMPLLCITLSLGLLKVIFLWLFRRQKNPMNKIKLK